MTQSKTTLRQALLYGLLGMLLCGATWSLYRAGFFLPWQDLGYPLAANPAARPLTAIQGTDGRLVQVKNSRGLVLQTLVERMDYWQHQHWAGFWFMVDAEQVLSAGADFGCPLRLLPPPPPRWTAAVQDSLVFNGCRLNIGVEQTRVILFEDGNVWVWRYAWYTAEDSGAGVWPWLLLGGVAGLGLSWPGQAGVNARRLILAGLALAALAGLYWLLPVSWPRFFSAAPSQVNWVYPPPLPPPQTQPYPLAQAQPRPYPLSTPPAWTPSAYQPSATPTATAYNFLLRPTATPLQATTTAYNFPPATLLSPPTPVPGRFPTLQALDPQAQTVYFLSDQGELWAANLDGSGVRWLRADVNEFALSPDRQWLAVLQAAHLWLLPANDQGEAQRLFWADPSQGYRLAQVHWSPDSRSLVFVQSGYPDAPSTQTIWQVEITNGQAQKLAQFKSGYPTLLAWSPDGSRLAFNQDGQLQLLELAGGRQTALSSVGCDGMLAALSWSPAGDYLLHSHYSNGRYSRLWHCLAGPDGASLSLDNGGMVSPAAWDVAGGGLYYLAQTMHWDAAENQIGGPVLLRYDLQTRQAQALLDWQAEPTGQVWNFSAAPNGEYLAYTYHAGLSRRLRLIRLADLQVIEYSLEGMAPLEEPAWSSGPRQLLLMSASHYRLLAFDPATGQIQPISDTR